MWWEDPEVLSLTISCWLISFYICSHLIQVLATHFHQAFLRRENLYHRTFQMKGFLRPQNPITLFYERQKSREDNCPRTPDPRKSLNGAWNGFSWRLCSLMGSCNGSVVKNTPAVQETQVPSLGWEDSLEEEMAMSWRIPWTEEPVLGVAKSQTTEPSHS